MPFDFILHDDSFDIDPFILNDLPFDAYYPLELIASHVGSGGAQSGGSALFRTVRFLAASGGAISGGQAGLVLVKVYAMQGGAVAGGSATMVYAPAQPAPQPSGGGISRPFRVPMLPPARLIRIYRYIMQGGAVAGGSAATQCIHALHGSGGALAGGSAGIEFAPAYQGSGGGLAGGEALLQLTRTFAYVGQPGDPLRWGGSALLRAVKQYQTERYADIFEAQERLSAEVAREDEDLLLELTGVL